MFWGEESKKISEKQTKAVLVFFYLLSPTSSFPQDSCSHSQELINFQWWNWMLEAETVCQGT